MNTAGLDVDRVKKNVIEYWQAEAWNWPVRIISLGRAQGFSVGRIVPVHGYITSEKSVRGRPLDLLEKILGLIPGELKNGGVALRLVRLPMAHEFELRGYTQTPGGEPYTGGAYPPGLGVSQWELISDVPAAVTKIAAPGQSL